MTTRSVFASSTVQGQNVRMSKQTWLDCICEKLKVLFTDIFPSNFTCVIPNAVSWTYRTLWTGSIRSCETFETVNKVADLFIHGDIVCKADGRVPAILMLHGEHSHALTMLHLGDVAESKGRAVFSVNLPYDDVNPESHLSLLRQSINRIEQMITKKGGRLSDLILAGHSRGAIESAYTAYVENNPKVRAVISLAGRFKVIEPSHRFCRESLRPTVNAVWEKVRPSQILRVPFYQIAAAQDWCIDPEASIVRPDCPHQYVNASHLGVINHPDTIQRFKEWVAT